MEQDGSQKALDTWREKLAALQVAEAKASDEAHKFKLGKDIEEAKEKIWELEVLLGMRSVTEIADGGVPGSSISVAHRIEDFIGQPATQAKPNLERGLQFGQRRWTLRGNEPIGVGRFGTVWRALDVETDEDVAIKFLLSDIANEPSTVRRFFRGAQVLKELQHEHMANVIEAEGVEQGYGYFVMEYLAGGSLAARMARGKMSLSEVRRMVQEVGGALHYLHGQGRVHRDVKPSNILQDREGRYKLVDFHFVHQDGEESFGGQDSHRILHFTAPEVMLADGPPSPKADVFSLGMTVLAALYGPGLSKTAMFRPERYIPGLAVHESIQLVLYEALELDMEDRLSRVSDFVHTFVEAVRVAMLDRSETSDDIPPPSVGTWSQPGPNGFDGDSMGSTISFGTSIVGTEDLAAPDPESLNPTLDESGLKSFLDTTWDGMTTAQDPVSSPFVSEIHPPSSFWAVDRGDDAYGHWADAELAPEDTSETAPIRFRMRWIPPGVFLMGSPESEAGRSEREGPQHEVMLSDGFWLAEAPCIQKLWQAIMGDNPSHFQSPTRPVEQVSSEDAAAFLKGLNERVPGMQARLPREAEWEYACRAGTVTPTYAEAFDIVGENHAAGLDDIAWYGGNSGVVFELDNGYDSADWPQKQYPHTKAGTHPAKRKTPNAWGLYDMLGNVWEWCQDDLHRYGEPTVTDSNPGPDSGQRVVRGGSWRDGARFVRAAYRSGSVPSVRNFRLGFRIAGGFGA